MPRRPARPHSARSARRTVPGWLWLPAGAASLFVLLPLAAMLDHVRVAQLPRLLTSSSSLDALRVSLVTAASSTVLCVVLGVPLALVLAHGRAQWLRALRAVVLVPMVLPPVVSGIALLDAFGREGLLGPALNVFGWDVGFTTVAVVMAQLFTSMPFFVIALEGALVRDRTFEDAAAVGGAGEGQILLHITLPLLRPALVAGSVMAFARALGEFGATITFAGALQGTTATVPVQVYLARYESPDAAVALSMVLVVVAIVVIAAVRPRGDLGTLAP